MRIALHVLGLLYLAYLALTLLVLLPALNFLVPWYVEKEYDREFRADLILFDPFALSLQVRGARLPENDGNEFLALRRAEVNLSLSSLWREGVVLDRLAVEELFLHLQRLQDGGLNIDVFLPPADASQDEDTAAGALPAVTVHDLTFTAQRIALTDQAREKPFSTHYDGLAIKVRDLTTVQEDGRPYRIVASGESGGTLLWEGTVSVPGASSEGRLALQGISLAPFWRFAEPWLAFELASGQLDMEGGYRISWAGNLDYGVTDGKLALSDIAIQPQDPQALPDTGVSLRQLALEGITVDGARQHLDLALASVDDLQVTGWMEGERMALLELFDTGKLPVTAEEEANDPAEVSSPWTAAVSRVQLSGNVDWRSEYTDPPQLQVQPIRASVENLSWPLQGESPLALELTVNQRAQLQGGGVLALAKGDGRLDYDLQGLYLPWFNPNLPKALKGRITDGEIKIKGAVSLAGFAPSTLSLDGGVNNFEAEIDDAEQAITSFETVRFSGLNVDLDERQLVMQQVIIDNYRGRIHIARDGSINANQVWQEEVGDAAEELANELELDKPWEVEIPAINISDSEVDFMDESLPITFRAVVGDLFGEILDISTDPGSTATVDIKGSVEGYAPVKLKGTARPLLQPPALDLVLTFDGVDLALLTPYSATYAGYEMERGLLSLRLAYKLEENKLQGDNQVVVDQLRLGAKVDSEQALDIPLELALALLTDANGVIDLAVPVSGDVNDPEFGLGGAISKAFINLLTKAVTAPFSLLAGLVGSEEDLQRVHFPTGSAELDERNKEKLRQLYTALEQRPNLTLVITGRLHPTADRTRLQAQYLNQQLQDGGISVESIKTKDDDFVAAIKRRYLELPGASTEASLGQQYDAVQASIAVSNDQLLALTEQRAVASKQFLVNELGMAADRAVIVQGTLDEEANRFGGVELGLEK